MAGKRLILGFENLEFCVVAPPPHAGTPLMQRLPQNLTLSTYGFSLSRVPRSFQGFSVDLQRVKSFGGG